MSNKKYSLKNSLKVSKNRPPFKTTLVKINKILEELEVSEIITTTVEVLKSIGDSVSVSYDKNSITSEICGDCADFHHLVCFSFMDCIAIKLEKMGIDIDIDNLYKLWTNKHFDFLDWFYLDFVYSPNSNINKVYYEKIK